MRFLIRYSLMASTSAKTVSKTTKASTPSKAPVEKKEKKSEEKKEVAKPAQVVAAAAPTDSTAQPAEDGTKKTRVRREINKETVASSFVVIQQKIDTEIKRLQVSKISNKSTSGPTGIKFLRSLNKMIRTLYSDTVRVLKLKKKSNRQNNEEAGFKKPVRISPELAAFMGKDPSTLISRVDVTKKICEYIREKSLYNKDDKRNILPDTALTNLLKYDPDNVPLDKKGKPQTLNYFLLQRYLSPHYISDDQDKSKVKPKKTKAKKTKKEVDEVPDDVQE